MGDEKGVGEKGSEKGWEMGEKWVGDVREGRGRWEKGWEKRKFEKLKRKDKIDAVWWGM